VTAAPGGVDLARKAGAELVGTAFLVAAVVGSGIMATRLSPDDAGLQLLQNSIATGAVLVALILTLQPVSAAFNPVVSLVEVVLGMVTPRVAAVLVAAQVVGGALGAVVANLMFDLDPVTWSATDRDGGHLWLGEAVATFGLVIVVFAPAVGRRWPTRSPATSPRPTGSPPRPASRTRRSPPVGCSRTRSPG